MRITSKQLRRIIREELLREGVGKHSALQFGQPDMRTFEESLEITFPYTIMGEREEAKLDYGHLDDAKADPSEVINLFAENHRNLAFRVDDDLEDDEEAIQIVKHALLSSPGFDMNQFVSDLMEIEPSHFVDY